MCQSLKLCGAIQGLSLLRYIFARKIYASSRRKLIVKFKNAGNPFSPNLILSSVKPLSHFRGTRALTFLTAWQWARFGLSALFDKLKDSSCNCRSSSCVKWRYENNLLQKMCNKRIKREQKSMRTNDREFEVYVPLFSTMSFLEAILNFSKQS